MGLTGGIKVMSSECYFLKKSFYKLKIYLRVLVKILNFMYFSNANIQYLKWISDIGNTFLWKNELLKNNIWWKDQLVHCFFIAPEQSMERALAKISNFTLFSKIHFSIPGQYFFGSFEKYASQHLNNHSWKFH